MNNKRFGSWFKLFPCRDITLYDGVLLDVEMPYNYDKCIPEIKIDDNYRYCNNNDNFKYFKDLSEKKIKIAVINDINLTETSRILKKCSYCLCIVSNNGFPIRYCKQCKKNMCKLCYDEKSEEIALDNGSKNWNMRKDDLKRCFDHVDELNIAHNLPVNCDLCGEKSKDCFGRWYCNRSTDKDICPVCFYTDSGQIFIKSERETWEGILYRDEYKNPNFGSMLNWVLLIDSDNGYVLYNINKDSVHYHKIALATIDNYDRHGIFITDYNLEELENTLKNEKSIKYLLECLDHETYYEN
jgi:hypothetical protein